jgi:DNA-binding MarR family transcriptional regulator
MPEYTLDQIRVDALDAHQPLGRHLILLFRAFERDLITALQQAGFDDVSEADLQILRFVRPEGSTAKEITALAGISKQAVGKTLASLESAGYLQRQPHTEDGRARLITFTPRGEALLWAAINHIGGVEQAYATQLGSECFNELKTMLATLLHWHTGGPL